jgi:hypothetical protein
LYDNKQITPQLRRVFMEAGLPAIASARLISCAMTPVKQDYQPCRVLVQPKFTLRRGKKQLYDVYQVARHPRQP